MNALKHYACPLAIAGDEELQAERLRATADAVNAQMPNKITEDYLRERMEDMVRSVMRTHRGSHWPSIPTFVDAMTKTLPPPSGASDTKFDLTPEAVAARRIKRGEPVDQRMLSGQCAETLISAHGVTRAEIDAYVRVINAG